jgi:hypothetical protein
MHAKHAQQRANAQRARVEHQVTCSGAVQAQYLQVPLETANSDGMQALMKRTTWHPTLCQQLRQPLAQEHNDMKADS